MKITPTEQRALAMKAVTTPQTLDRWGVKAGNSAATNQKNALVSATAMVAKAVASKDRASVLFEFAGIERGGSERAIRGMVKIIGCSPFAISSRLPENDTASNAMAFKEWQIEADDAGDWELAAKIGAAWAFYVNGEWNDE